MGYMLPPVAGCVLHLDASVASSVTHVSGVVSQWSDLSGYGNHATQGTEARKPTFGTDSTTGLGKITFDGITGANGDRLAVADHASLDLTTGISLFVAADLVGFTSNYGCILSKDDTTWTSAYRLNRSTTALYFGVDATSSTVIASYAGRHLFAGSKAGTGNIKGYVDSTTVVGDAAYGSNITANAKALNIGHAGVDGYGMEGSLFEILLFNVSVTATERLQITNYLVNKWRVGSFWTLNSGFEGQVRRSHRPAPFKPGGTLRDGFRKGWLS